MTPVPRREGVPGAPTDPDHGQPGVRGHAVRRHGREGAHQGAGRQPGRLQEPHAVSTLSDW